MVCIGAVVGDRRLSRLDALLLGDTDVTALREAIPGLKELVLGGEVARKRIRKKHGSLVVRDAQRKAERHEAAFTAAYVRYRDLHDGERALRDLSGIDDKGSPLEERALVLRVQILVSLDRKHEAAVAAARYLDRFRAGSSAPVVRALLDKLSPAQK